MGFFCGLKPTWDGIAIGILMIFLAVNEFFMDVIWIYIKSKTNASKTAARESLAGPILNFNLKTMLIFKKADETVRSESYDITSRLQLFYRMWQGN